MSSAVKNHPRKEGNASHDESAETRSQGLDRRCMLKMIGLAGVMAAGVGPLESARTSDKEDPFGILIDTTRCGGCRTCEYMCAEANDLPEPDDDADMDRERRTSETQWTVVNRFETDAGEVYVKRQCMHCLQPACASACLTKAMLKTAEGPVVWRQSKCMGCRFCMVSCPFDMPKFEYHSATPRIRKCRLCVERIQDGGKPACVENCPAEALMFGRRSQLMKEARRRIHENPDGYVDAVYGEDVVGGTSALYLSAVPFEQIGFRTDLGDDSYPRLTEDFLYAVPVVLTLLPPLLLGISNATKREPENASAALKEVA